MTDLNTSHFLQRWERSAASAADASQGFEADRPTEQMGVW